MRFIIYIIGFSCIPFILYFITLSINKRNKKQLINNLTKDHLIVKLPMAYFWVGSVDVLFMAIFLLASYYSSQDTAGFSMHVAYVLFTLLMIPGFILVVATKIWKIEIFRQEEFFIYKTIFCKKYKIWYKDCIGYKWSNNMFKLKTVKKNFYIDFRATNFEFFLAMIIQNKVKKL